MKKKNIILIGFCAALSLNILGGCSGVETSAPESYPMSKEDERRAKRGKVFGDGGISLFGTGKNDAAQSGGMGIGVNAYLWRSALETLSFLPLSSVDPHGGVIITDWYSDPAVPNERIKLNVLILDTALRVDAIKITVFKQQLQKGGAWVDVTVGKETATALEDKILVRARELRIKKVKG